MSFCTVYHSGCGSDIKLHFIFEILGFAQCRIGLQCKVITFSQLPSHSMSDITVSQ